ncbi:hypothetical protein DAPPUDRAFT_110980 [Daphnia pulex]|uniref:Uncharacterized protein n=1 Tax=Daphnia pulex TaxID=6669 RepID=E9H7S6_DAPPU|nr:hypothetical protein DAPPUDRAFT_110980 [Daphnia pulex]|eukprot:EFX72250.1 hypothetical protein DAPPUDRAFT_110980 [Daphnia pulex]
MRAGDSAKIADGSAISARIARNDGRGRYLLLHSDTMRPSPIRKRLIKLYSDRLDWTPAVLDNFVTFISRMVTSPCSSILDLVFQNEFTPIHALYWLYHSFYTEGARRQEIFVIDTVLCARQRIFNMFGDFAIILLLPELDWSVRRQLTHSLQLDQTAGRVRVAVRFPTSLVKCLRKRLARMITLERSSSSNSWPITFGSPYSSPSLFIKVKKSSRVSFNNSS